MRPYEWRRLPRESIERTLRGGPSIPLPSSCFRGRAEISTNIKLLRFMAEFGRKSLPQTLEEYDATGRNLGSHFLSFAMNNRVELVAQMSQRRAIDERKTVRDVAKLARSLRDRGQACDVAKPAKPPASLFARSSLSRTATRQCSIA